MHMCMLHQHYTSITQACFRTQVLFLEHNTCARPVCKMKCLLCINDDVRAAWFEMSAWGRPFCESHWPSQTGWTLTLCLTKCSIGCLRFPEWVGFTVTQTWQTALHLPGSSLGRGSTVKKHSSVFLPPPEGKHQPSGQGVRGRSRAW